jgi:hypothetical protein
METVAHIGKPARSVRRASSARSSRMTEMFCCSICGTEHLREGGDVRSDCMSSLWSLHKDRWRERFEWPRSPLGIAANS